MTERPHDRDIGELQADMRNTIKLLDGFGTALREHAERTRQQFDGLEKSIAFPSVGAGASGNYVIYFECIWKNGANVQANKYLNNSNGVVNSGTGNSVGVATP
jgi:hypothetical protein